MRSQRILGFAVLAFVVVFLMLRGVVSAHHSTAVFADEEKAMKGTVVEYRWRNPHVFVVWDVKDDSGKVAQWIGELASVSSLMADGMTKNSLKPGDEIIITVRPAKAGTPQSVISHIMKTDGTVVLKWGRQGGGSDEVRAKREAARGKLLEPFLTGINKK